MRHLFIATALAAATLLSPAAIVLSGPAAAIDCSDKAAPESRPDGYCAQATPGGKTLSGTVSAPPPDPCVAFLEVPRTKGARILVAAKC